MDYGISYWSGQIFHMNEFHRCSFTPINQSSVPDKNIPLLISPLFQVNWILPHKLRSIYDCLKTMKLYKISNNLLLWVCTAGVQRLWGYQGDNNGNNSQWVNNAQCNGEQLNTKLITQVTGREIWMNFLMLPLAIRGQFGFSCHSIYVHP